MQFFYDVTELAQRDHHTGIQRVVRSILMQLMSNPPPGCTVEPVRARHHQEGYLYARRFTRAFLGATAQAAGDAVDSPIEPDAGDIFLRLELQPEVVLAQADTYADLRGVGVKVFFGVHDLLPIHMPQYFPEGTAEAHHRWLGRLARADGLVCVSRTVADEVAQWMTGESIQRLRPLKLGWFHLGADLAGSAPTRGLPPNARQVLAALAAAPSFLMVSTLEPRKGHRQALAAFEQLWARGDRVQLVLVGQHGWHMTPFVEGLKSHPELGRRLHWLHPVSDEYLDQIYAACTCLLAASEGEGFGLPLIEAARHQRPILARDLPVFHEVAGPHATYFSGLSPETLAHAVTHWLALHTGGRAPLSTPLRVQSWKESTEQLMQVLLGGQWHQDWVSDGVLRLHGDDPRLHSHGGQRLGRQIHSTGQSGHLVYGPYVFLAAGRYEVRLLGRFAGPRGANPNMEVTGDGGNRRLARLDLYGHGLDEDSERVLAFELKDDCADLEVRVWVEDCNVVTVHRMEIHPLPAHTR